MPARCAEAQASAPVCKLRSALLAPDKFFLLIVLQACCNVCFAGLGLALACSTFGTASWTPSIYATFHCHQVSAPVLLTVHVLLCSLCKHGTAAWLFLHAYSTLLQASSAQDATLKYSSSSASSNCLGMRWYMTEAPSSHLCHSHSASRFQTRQQTSSAAEECPISREFQSQRGFAVLHNKALKSLNGLFLTRFYTNSLGTILRVFAASLLLSVYFVLLASGF